MTQSQHPASPTSPFSAQAVHALLAPLEPPFGPYDALSLTGDASARRYFRLRSRQDSTRTLILMVMDPKAPLASEEFGWEGVEPDELLFINVQRFLHPLGAAVPAVYGYDAVHGLMVLEDLGDLTLEAWMRSRAWDEIEAMYRDALDALIALQVNACLSPRLSETWASRVAFDEALFLKEFDHFYEYTVEARVGALADASKQVLDQQFRSLSATLAALPRYFVHRDFHCRNLMVHHGHIVLIDFQDAVMGPRHYDLVSLLKDAYVTLPEPVLSRLQRYYYDAFEAYAAQKGAPGAGESYDAYLLHFDLVSLHRSMKAAGRFDFIDLVKKNPKFKAWIPEALVNVGRVLRTYPALAPLRDVLLQKLPGLA